MQNNINAGYFLYATEILFKILMKYNNNVFYVIKRIILDTCIFFTRAERFLKVHI